MSAALKVEPIKARVVSRPEYDNDWIDVQSKWIRDNYLLLEEWFSADGAKPELAEFPIFCITQYEQTCLEVAEEEAEQELLQADYEYDRGRAL